MFWVVAAIAAVCAAMSAAGPVGAFALVMLILAVVCHVAGNAIGTRLRELGDHPSVREPAAYVPHRRLEVTDFAPATRLCERTRLSLVMIIFSVAGAVLVGLPGGAALIWLVWSHANLPTAIVAVLSCSVLGGFLGFMASSFTQTAAAAWWQARCEARRGQAGDAA